MKCARTEKWDCVPNSGLWTRIDGSMQDAYVFMHIHQKPAYTNRINIDMPTHIIR